MGTSEKFKQSAVDDYFGLIRLIVGFKTGLRPLDFRFSASFLCFGSVLKVEGMREGAI